MNIEVFTAVLAVLIMYRVVSPLIDAINPLGRLTKPKGPDGAHAIQGIPGGPKVGAGRGR